MMHSNSLRRTAVLLLSLVTLLTCTTAQGTAPGSGNAIATQQPNDDRGLPAFLLEVPGGPTQVGLEVDAFVRACAEASFKYDPANAHKKAAEKFVTTMRRTASVLPRKTLDVDTFFLGKWPVKNSEYQVYVERLRAAGVDIRVPYHWWRWGREDDYNQKLKDIRKEFPKMENAPLLYWERHGHELPFKVADKDGNSTADQPVTFISYRDANRFAASLGMRLPTEAELIRAMRGDGTYTWPGGDQADQDHFSDDLLKLLGQSNTTDQVIKPVGTVKGAVGPFGHVDMFGQVWQFVGDIGYEPIVGVEAWNDAWKDLQKHKTGGLLTKQPAFLADRAIAKGGSWLSFQEPIQLAIDARAPIQTSDVLESLGMRLAKSLKPGYDYVYSLQRVEFTRDAFAKNQDIVLDQLVGAERYTLGADGFPTNYETVSFAPANWLFDEKRMRTRDMAELSQERPIVIGVLATSVTLLNGSKPGLYTTYYRAAGIPKDLRDAVKRGHKEVVKARKAAEKNKGKEKKEKDDKQEKASKWRALTKKYGLTDDDLADPKAQNGDCGYVRLDGVEVPTDTDTFLLSKQGKVVAFLRGTKRKPQGGKLPFTAELTLDAGDKDQAGKAVANFKVAMPMLARDNKKLVVFELPVPLDLAPPAADQPWRLPEAAPAKGTSKPK